MTFEKGEQQLELLILTVVGGAGTGELLAGEQGYLITMPVAPGRGSILMNVISSERIDPCRKAVGTIVIVNPHWRECEIGVDAVVLGYRHSPVISHKSHKGCRYMVIRIIQFKVVPVMPEIVQSIFTFQAQVVSLYYLYRLLPLSSRSKA